MTDCAPVKRRALGGGPPCRYRTDGHTPIRTSKRRLAMALALAAALTPGLWWRETRIAQGPTAVTIATLSIPHTIGGTDLALTGAWHIVGPTARVGGFSGLAVTRDGFWAVSDAGTALRLELDAAGEPQPRDLRVVVEDLDTPKWDRDIESATADGAGRIWLGFESSNAIRRVDGGLRPLGEVRPDSMAGWPANSGPEGMARLSDGRFVVLAEDTGGVTANEAKGLLFPSDPLDGGEPVSFRFQPPYGSSATDLAQLPDGRLIVLMRRLELLPPGFVTRVALAEPADIVEGELLPWEELSLPAGFPTENYEGIAVVPRKGGALDIWMISDDNFAVYQRTLLLRWRWNPRDERANRRTPGSGGPS
ncbi:esterase-like activity of phytase family protein [Altererythrobacter sp. CAU 1778]